MTSAILTGRKKMNQYAKKQFNSTYEISPNGAKAARNCAESISGLTSPT